MGTPCGEHLQREVSCPVFRLGEEVLGRNFLTSSLLIRLVCFVGHAYGLDYLRIKRDFERGERIMVI